MGLFEDIFSATECLQPVQPREKQSNLQLLMVTLGTAIAFSIDLELHNHSKVKKLAADAWRGFEDSLDLTDHTARTSLPENQTSDLFYHVCSIGQVLSSWSAGVFGNRPDYVELESLRHALDWGLRGSSYNQRRNLCNTYEQLLAMQPMAYLDYYLKDEIDELSIAIDKVCHCPGTIDLFDIQPMRKTA